MDAVCSVVLVCQPFDLIICKNLYHSGKIRFYFWSQQPEVNYLFPLSRQNGRT